MVITSMGLGGTLRALGRFIEDCEQRGNVDDVNLTAERGPAFTGRLAADVELTLATCPSTADRPAVSLAAVDVDDEGRLELTFESDSAVLPVPPDGVAIEPIDASLDAAGTVAVDLTASTPVGDDGDATDLPSGTVDADGVVPDHEQEQSDCPSESQRRAADEGGAVQTADDGQSATASGTGGDRELPPFEDPEFLRDIYESHETFAEMQEALEMDVTAETVRRYMISHGIHEPNSYDTAEGDGTEAVSAAAADTEAPDVIADGIGLPEDVTVDTLVDSVRRSNTVYELKSEIGTDREQALEMLRQLDLVDHVVGRLAKKDEREVSRELVVERLRRHADPE